MVTILIGRNTLLVERPNAENMLYPMMFHFKPNFLGHSRIAPRPFPDFIITPPNIGRIGQCLVAAVLVFVYMLLGGGPILNRYKRAMHLYRGKHIKKKISDSERYLRRVQTFCWFYFQFVFQIRKRPSLS